MTPEILLSYDYCRRVAQRAKSNFTGTFYLLPRRQRLAMYALYAFTRVADDAGDGDGSPYRRKTQIKAMRRALDASLDGVNCSGMYPALVDAVRRFDIPVQCLYDVLDGVASDLEVVRIQTWEELQEYCRQVAGVVGLACIHIWGFRDAEVAAEAAAAAGRGFQLTNILRDLAEDALRDRLYLPQAELDQFDYSFDELRRGVVDDRTRALLDFQIDRARGEYSAADGLHDVLSPSGRRMYRAMSGVYQALLDEIAKRRDEVLLRRVRVGRLRKFRILARAVAPPARRPGAAVAKSAP